MATPLRTVSRRQFMVAAAGSALTTSALALPSGPDPLASEQQQGDPDVASETLTYDPRTVDALVRGAQKATFADYRSDFPKALAALAPDCVGINREQNRREISQYLGLFRLPFEENGRALPFCAAGLAYLGLHTYAHLLGKRGDELASQDTLRSLMPDLDYHYFYPSPSVRDVYHIAKGRRRWRPSSSKAGVQVPETGWIVLFQFAAAEPDHCGLVLTADQHSLNTIEFNTAGKVGDSQRNGGVVAYRTRQYRYVQGFVDTNGRTT